MRKALIPASIVTAVAFVLNGANAAAKPTTGSSTSRSSVVVMTRKLPKLGTILVNSKGRTLYMFVPDKQKKVTCVGACAAVWPPLKVAKGAKAVAKGAVKKSLLRSDKDPAGGYVVTYNGWPLYTYVADTSAGKASGQALNLNGGLWYVLSPSGKVIKTKIS